MTEDRTPDAPDSEDELSLEDLAMIACGGDIEDELRERITKTLRTDPRYVRKFEKLEVMRLEAAARNIWEGLDRHREFEQLLEDDSWDEPVEVLFPRDLDDFGLDYRQLIAIAEIRAERAKDPRQILSVRERLLKAEEKHIENAASKVAASVRQLSTHAVEQIFAEVRRRWQERRRRESG